MKRSISLSVCLLVCRVDPAVDAVRGDRHGQCQCEASGAQSYLKDSLPVTLTTLKDEASGARSLLKDAANEEFSPSVRRQGRNRLPRLMRSLVFSWPGQHAQDLDYDAAAVRSSPASRAPSVTSTRHPLTSVRLLDVPLTLSASP